MTPPRGRGPCRSSEAVFGLLLLLGGVLWLLVVTGVTQAQQIWIYWPAVFTLLGLGKLFSRRRRQVVAGLWWIGISLLLLDVQAGLFGYELFKVAPVLLILAGGGYLWRGIRQSRGSEAATGLVAADGADLRFAAVFGGTEQTVRSQPFRSGDVSAVFGGCELDFRPAQIEGTAEMHVFACFGGVNILVPEAWTVVSHGSAVLGSFEVDTERAPPEGGAPTADETSGPRLIVRGTAILSSVTVTNDERVLTGRRSRVS